MSINWLEVTAARNGLRKTRMAAVGQRFLSRGVRQLVHQDGFMGVQMKADNEVAGISLVACLVAWMLANPIAAATLFGGAIYIMVFESYRSALYPFGVTPADVGIGYADVIWPVASSLYFLAFVVFLLLALVVRSPRGFAGIWEWRVPIIISSLVAIAAILTVLAMTEEAQYRASVQAGETHNPIFTSRLQVLAALRANRVKAAWKDAAASRPPLPAGNLLFLGAANGTSIIYASSDGATLRVPTSDIVLTDIRTPAAKAAPPAPSGTGTQ